MEVSLVAPNCLKIRSRNASFIVNPTSLLKTKILSDAIILLNGSKDYDFSRVEESRCVIQGAGEYEISGVKITTDKAGEDLICNLRIDGLDMVLANAKALETGKEKLKEHNAAIVNVNSLIDQSIITSLNARVVILYGEKSLEFVKSIGKEIKPSAKFTTTLEKLPAETEIIMLS